MYILKKIYYSFFRLAKRVRNIKPSLLLQLIIVETLMMLDRWRGKKTLILLIGHLSHIQYILPVVEALKKKEPPIAYYIATDYISFDETLAPLNVPKNRVFYPSVCSWLRMADMFLSASVWGKGPKRAIKINISHNQPVKVECYSKELLLNYDVHFLLGPLHRAQYENMFAKHGIRTNNIQMLNIGYPKSDALLQGVYNRDDVLRGLGLNVEKPTVLYAPTWEAGASLRSFGEEVIGRLLTLKNVNTIVKLHPVSYTPETSPNFSFYTGGVNWVAKLSRFERHPNFKHVSEYSVDPLLIASDVMVTDISSVALEFIMLDRPVIYLDCPEYFEKTLKSVYWNNDPEFARSDPRANAGRHVGLVVEDLTKLVDAVQRSLNNPGEFSDKRMALAECLLYNRGKGAEAAADAITELLTLV